MYANKFCDAGQVPIFRYLEALHKDRVEQDQIACMISLIWIHTVC